LSFNPAPQRWFSDIIGAVAMIEQFTAGMDFEAAIRLGDEAERCCPEQPWRDIRGIGNQLRHAYERVDLKPVWDTMTDDLPPLRAAVLRALVPPPVNPKDPSLG
jgi:uncharacterized protein with HEPN domain